MLQNGELRWGGGVRWEPAGEELVLGEQGRDTLPECFLVPGPTVFPVQGKAASLSGAGFSFRRQDVICFDL